MRQESGFWIALNWSKIEKMKMTSEFANMTSLSNLFDVSMFLL